MYLLADGTMCADKVIYCSELAGYQVVIIEQYNGFKTALIETVFFKLGEFESIAAAKKMHSGVQPNMLQRN